MQEYLETLGTPGPAIFAVTGFLALAFLVGRIVLARGRVAGVRYSGPRKVTPGPTEVTEYRDLGHRSAAFLSLILGIDLLIAAAMALFWLRMLPDSLPVTLLLALTWIMAPAACAFLLIQRVRLAGIPAISWPLVPIVVLGVILSLNALSYPYSYDDLAYQVAVPMRWMRDGSLAVYRDNPYSGFPGANLVANLLLLKTGGILAPSVFNFALGMIILFGVHFLLRARITPWAATILTLAFALSLPFLMVIASAYAEPLILLQFVGILLALDSSLRPIAPSPPGTPGGEGRGEGGQNASPKRDGFARRHPLTISPLPRSTGGEGRWLLVGFFAGMAASVKLTGLIIPAAVFLIIPLTSWRQPKALAVKLGCFLCPLLLVMALFYARPYLATGDPAYPYFASLFTQRARTLAMSEYHHDAGREKFGTSTESPGEAISSYFATPWLLTTDRLSRPTFLEFDRSESVGPARNFDGTFGLQLAVLLLMIAMGIVGAIRTRRFPPQLLVYIGLALVFYTFWYCTAQQSRFLLPGFLCILLAGSFALPMVPNSMSKIILGLVLAATLASLPMLIVKQVYNGWENLVTREHKSIDFVFSAMPENDPYLNACNLIRKAAPSDARILLLFERRGLYIARSYEIGTPYFQEKFYTPADRCTTAMDFADALHGANITHVLVASDDVYDPDRMKKYVELSEPIRQRIDECIKAKYLEPMLDMPPLRKGFTIPAYRLLIVRYGKRND